MISRLTAHATVFSIVGASLLAAAVGSSAHAKGQAAQQSPGVQLERVEIVVKREPRAPVPASTERTGS